GVGRQHHAELVAGGLREVAEKRRLLPAAIPVLLHRDIIAVGEMEPGDVDGEAARMLAHMPAADHAAAGISAELAHRDDPGAEPALRQVFRRAAEKIVEPRGEAASEETRRLPRHRRVGDAHRIVDGAGGTRRVDRLGPERDTMRFEIVETGPRGAVLAAKEA